MRCVFLFQSDKVDTNGDKYAGKKLVRENFLRRVELFSTLNLRIK